ncbi:MAG: hypothetical protein WBJ62_05560 [Coriobacteriia bacterium]
MRVSLQIGDVFAGLALVLSVIATVTTVRFNSRQKSLIESQELLNQRLLTREENEARADRRADLGANLIKLGKSNWRLKVYNKGKAPARDVTISCPDGDNLLIQSDVNSKFPLEVLEPMQGVELHAAVYLGSKSKYTITLRWADDFSDSNEKTVYPTL